MTARRPIPPVSFRTADLQTLEDLRKLRASQADILTYLDALIAGTGAGTVTSVVAGTGVSVTNPAGPAVTVANAGVLSVTAGTNITVTGTAANPVINGAAAGAVTSFNARTGAVVPVYNDYQPFVPYLTAPASANAFDDEFDTGSADLATRGWTFRNTATATNMTRIGDINPWQTLTALTANQYRSRLDRGCLYLQLPTNTGHDFTLYKTIAVPAGTGTTNDGITIWGRVAAPVNADTAASGYTNVSVWNSSGGFPDLNNRFFLEINHQGGTTFRYRRTWIQAGASGSSANYDLTAPGQIHDMIGLRINGNNVTPTVRYFAADSARHAIWSPPTLAATVSTKASLVFGGMGFFSPAAGADGNSSAIRVIDFLRLNSGAQDNFWIGTP